VARFSPPVQTSPGAHSASYTRGTRFFIFPRGKATRVWHWLPIPI